MNDNTPALRISAYPDVYRALVNALTYLQGDERQIAEKALRKARGED